ncbi:MAG: hypothetical protein ACK5O4_01460 [bacterium]|jgi:hypothetical protein
MDLHSQNIRSSLPFSTKKAALSGPLKEDSEAKQKRRQAILALKAIGDLYPLNPGAAGISGMLARGRR